MKIPDYEDLSSKQITQMLSHSSPQEIEEKISNLIEHVQEDLEKASILSAISFQPGAIPLETIIRLQNEDPFCQQIKSEPTSYYTTRKGILLRIDLIWFDVYLASYVINVQYMITRYNQRHNYNLIKSVRCQVFSQLSSKITQPRKYYLVDNRYTVNFVLYKIQEVLR